MNAEIAALKDLTELKGWVLYDATCSRCCRLAQLFEPVLTRRRYDLAPLQSPWVSECLDIAVTVPPAAMEVVMMDGHRYSGADALIHLAGTIWWAWPWVGLARIPGLRQCLRALYTWVAARRSCNGGRCATDQRPLALR